MSTLLSPAPFDELEDEVSAACDDLFGEAFELQPMRAPAPNVRREPDTGRIKCGFRAIFDERPKFTEAGSGGLTDFKRISTGRDDTNSYLSVDDAELSKVDRRPGDRVLRIKTQALYELGNPRPDGMGRTVFPLTSIKAGDRA